MKTTTFILGCIVLLTCHRLDAQPMVKPSQDGASLLKQQLDTILSSPVFDFTLTGVLVKSLTTNEPLYERNPDLQLIPASVTKLILTSTFLHRLYSKFSYKILVYSQNGNLWVKPSGDPLLDHAQLWALIQQFKFYGIREIKGNVFFDLSAFQVVDSIDQEFDPSLRYNSVLSPFSLGFNVVFLNIIPATKDGKPAEIYLLPDVDYFRVENRTKTILSPSKEKPPNGLDIHFLHSNGKQILEVTGNVTVPKIMYVKIPDPVAYIKTVLKDYLNRSSIKFDGDVLTGSDTKSVPTDARLRFEFPGRMIPEVLRLMNAFSNNFMAEQLLLTLGGEVLGYPSTMEKGAQVIHDFLVSDVGFTEGNFKFVNGSGLTRSNRISPKDMVTFLEWNSRSAFFPEFLSMIGDAEHTAFLAKSVKGQDFQNTLRAKSGTLDDVCAIAGYLKKEPGWIAFSIFTNQAQKENIPAIRQKQMEIIEAIHNSGRKEIEKNSPMVVDKK